MGKSVLDSIDDNDLSKLNLRILINGADGENGRYVQNNETLYIQITDSKGIMDDGTYRFHFELLRSYENKKKYGREKDKIYVEAHFEESKCNKFFNVIVTRLLEENEDLEAFPWYKDCPLIRLKNNGFQLTEKEEILKNLKKLKQLILRTIINSYELSSVDENFISNFEYIKTSGKNTCAKRNINAITRKAIEIDVLHEEIKANLITALNKNPSIMGIEYEINIKSLVPEHPINGNNYIDLVAKTTNGKIIFFEIKTAVSARLCIRQALGQLMEYAYFPNENHADRLVIVGTGKKDKNIKNYLNKLNSNFNINIEYLSI